MERKHVILLSIIGIIAIIAAIASATFAYLARVITPGDEIKETVIETRPLNPNVSYDHEGVINIENAVPGSSETMQVIINNTDDTNGITYDLYWDNVNNTFDLSAKDLVYSVNCESSDNEIILNSIQNVSVPSTSTNKQDILSNIYLGPNVTHTCVVKIDFLNLDTAQDNMGKSFSGTIKVK